MNRYDEAIGRSEQKEFLLGRGEYFYLDMNWGDHDSSLTAYDQLEYAKQHSEEKLQSELSKDILNTLQDGNISVKELVTLIDYVSIYLIKKTKGDYKTDWKVSGEIKALIKGQIISKELQGLDLSDLRKGLMLMKSQYGFSLD